MKGWVGLVGWPVADGLPTLVVTHQLLVESRTGKVRQSETDVLPLCHATNQGRKEAYVPQTSAFRPDVLIELRLVKNGIHCITHWPVMRHHWHCPCVCRIIDRSCDVRRVCCWAPCKRKISIDSSSSSSECEQCRVDRGRRKLSRGELLAWIDGEEEVRL